MNFEREGLLDGLDGEERDARQQLLEQLADDGFSLDELKKAAEEDRLALLPVERVLGARYTIDEVAKRAELSAEQLRGIWRALGFADPEPEEKVWSDEDVQALGAIAQFLEAGMSQESLMEITRVLGEAMSRLGPTITASFAETYLRPGDTERDVALRYEAMAKELLPAISPVLTAALKAYVRESARRGILSRAERERGSLATEEKAVVCFADLVGFTRLGGDVGAEELGTVARRLAEIAAEVSEGPVRLVKTIGDAAMFVSPEHAPLVKVALSFVEAVEEAELPSLRAGIASGQVLNRAGDWYGHTVNLASRVTGVARPDSVLCTQEVRDATEDEFDWSFAGRHRLKGVPDRMPLHRARRLGEKRKR